MTAESLMLSMSPRARRLLDAAEKTNPHARPKRHRTTRWDEWHPAIRSLLAKKMTLTEVTEWMLDQEEEAAKSAKQTFVRPPLRGGGWHNYYRVVRLVEKRMKREAAVQRKLEAAAAPKP